ncbi:hypothetical protein AGMMS4956_00890 [Bacteroidia bacterium]|nr:hypothetical protein AGMMS4956_00890 [Bacteroidia bacterium]
MKKTFMKVALMSLVVAGATFVACNKDDNSSPADKGTNAAKVVTDCFDAEWKAGGAEGDYGKCWDLIAGDTSLNLTYEEQQAYGEAAEKEVENWFDKLTGEKKDFFEVLFGGNDNDPTEAPSYTGNGNATEDAGKFIAGGMAALGKSDEEALPIILANLQTNVDRSRLNFDEQGQPVGDYTTTLVTAITNTLTQVGQADKAADLIGVIIGYASGAFDGSDGSAAGGNG